MIEVKMFLYDALEISLMSQFEAILQQKRAQAGETTVAPPPLAQTSTPSEVNIPAAPTASTLTSAHVEAPAGDTVMMNAPAPAVEVDDVTVQRTITAYGQKHGVPATVAKMQELFGVSQASKVPVERRAEFVEAFKV